MSAPALPPEVFAQVTQAWAIQDYAEGERLLAEARKRYPDHWHLRTCHAAAIGYCSRFRSAKAEFDSLIEDAPAEKRVHMHGLLGVEWCRIGRHDLAIPLLRVAAAAPDPVAPVFEGLASALEHVRDFQGAQDVLDEGLRRHPGHPGLLLVMASVRRQQGKSDLAEVAARAVLVNRMSSPDALGRAGHELGHALDAQGDYAGAFAAFVAAKQARIPALAPFLPIWEANQNALREAVPPARADFLRWSSGPAPSGFSRIAMLVGCPRSGTTLLERVLDSHPDLISASETTVFGNLWNVCLRSMPRRGNWADTLDLLTDEDVRRFQGIYQEQMEDALEAPADGRVLLDKNPSQLSRLPAIMRLFPGVCILMALRDPRAILWSCFTQHLPDNAESAGFNQLDTAARHVAGHLDFWLRLRDRLPDRSFHETRYEGMVGDFETTTRSTLAALGLPWDAQVIDYHNQSGPVRSPTYAEASRPIYQHAVEKWRNYQPFLGDTMRPLIAVSKSLGYVWD